MRWVLYNILFSVGFLIALPRHLVRMWRRGGYGYHFFERFGRYDPVTRAALAEGGRVWIHAVSVGELFVALGFMETFRRHDPKVRFLVSVTTSTAHRIARKRLSGSPDVLVYFPLDLPPIQRRILRLARPAALLLVESEIWPNLIRLAKKEGVRVGLINGRISASSARGYRALSWFSRPVFRLLDCACMQSEGDRERILRLGAGPERVHVCGSMKYDSAETDDTAESEMRAMLRSAGFPDDVCLLLGGSTWPGEEAALLAIYTRLKPDFPRLALGLAPRHIERMPEVKTELEKHVLTTVFRSSLPDQAKTGQKAPDVFVLDTTGELRRFYAGADLVFIGKSLTQAGGQNPIEPAAWGKAVLCGPNMQNFPVIMSDFLETNALLQVADAHELEAAIRRLLADPEECMAWGRRAGELVRRKKGAGERTLDRLALIQKSG